MKDVDWDIFCVQIQSSDALQHKIWWALDPESPDYSEESKNEAMSFYRGCDEIIGQLVEAAGPDSLTNVVSDHGFHSDHLRPAVTPDTPAGITVWHRKQGIFAASGPGLLADELVHGAGLLDVTPTVLTWLGLPVGDDMDGKPLVAAFESPPEIRRIPSWEDVAGDDGRHPPESRFDVGKVTAAEPSICIAGEVLQGKKKPHECEAFGTQCTPEHPLGAPMVSTEGACSAYHAFRRYEDSNDGV